MIWAAVYLGIWAFSLIVFWCLMNPSDAMGYAILFMWGLLPITTAAVSWSIGRSGRFGLWKWLVPVVLGAFYMLQDYVTFKTANMLTFHKIHLPDVELFLAGTLISAAGLGIGPAVHHRRSKKRPS